MNQPTLSGRASQAWLDAQKAAALAEVRAEIVPTDPELIRAAEAWHRQTVETRTAASELAERLLGVPADPDAWAVRRDSTTVAHTTLDGLDVAVWPYHQLGRGMTHLVLGVAMPGSKKPFKPVASLEELGAFLAEHAPPRAAE
jgi:hypothetical protein